MFNQFEGRWQLERGILPGGAMRGEAKFISVSKVEFNYMEQGVLTLDHGDVIHDVTRSYIYKLEDDHIQVFYADGSDDGALFHVLKFENEREAQAEHLCGEDFYRSHYAFDLPDCFTITHEVKGPKKDYVSKTIFTRLDKS